MKCIRRVAAGAVLTACILVVPLSSRADDDEGMVRLYSTLSAGAFVCLGGLVTDVGIAVNMANNWDEGKRWEIAGLVVGGASTAAGIALAVISRDEEDMLWWMIPNLVVGVSNIVLASTSLSLMPKGVPKSVSIAPLVAPDGQGGYYSGVGVSVVGW